jgi:hypothetical protein
MAREPAAFAGAVRMAFKLRDLGGLPKALDGGEVVIVSLGEVA